MVATDREWLEVDGRGGFSTGSIDGVRRRRYHALLQVSNEDCTARFVLVNGFDIHLITPTGRYPLSSHSYSPGVISPDTRGCLVAFDPEPWPTWRLRVPDGTEIIQEIMIRRGRSATLARWRIASGSDAAYLSVRPFLSGRDAHMLHRENRSFDFDPEEKAGWLIWRPYSGVPGIALGANAAYSHDPRWYRNFRYDFDQIRGYDYEEDLAAPGLLTWDLSKGDAVLIMAGLGPGLESPDDLSSNDPAELAGSWTKAELERRSGLARGRIRLDDYLVERDSRMFVVGGFPWSGPDPEAATFLIRALIRVPDGLDRAAQLIRSCLDESVEKRPMVSTLWLILAIHEFLEAGERTGFLLLDGESGRLRGSIQNLLDAIVTSEITDGGVAPDEDGLLRVAPGCTWMGGRVGERLATPRAGKPVEVQALWLNALRIGALFDSRWETLFESGLKSFRSRFWNRETGCLFDIVDGPEGADGAIRPNQVLAVGGLPFPLLKHQRAAEVLEVVEQVLLTPAGLRSLDPQSVDYRGFCRGGEWERTAAIHQGSAWYWWLGPFVEGWLRVHGRSRKNIDLARRRFLEPVEKFRGLAMEGHFAELSDGNPPHQWRECPASAVSDALLEGLGNSLDKDVL